MTHKDVRLIAGRFSTRTYIAHYGDTGGISISQSWLGNDDGTYTIVDPFMWAELNLPGEGK